MTAFDDHLGLRSTDFSDRKLVVFTGRSGSGKSTAIRWLLDEHPDFRGRECSILERPAFHGIPRRGADVLVLDDLVNPRDLRHLAVLLGRARTILAASHLSHLWFLPLRSFWPVALFRTDTDTGKIARYLKRRGVRASEDAVVRFVAEFGATYTDVELVLERYPAESFDAALARFTKFCRLRLDSPGA